jgi:FKBP-type peptidyl-prolyl cis-trans isomerase
MKIFWSLIIIGAFAGLVIWLSGGREKASQNPEPVVSDNTTEVAEQVVKTDEGTGVKTPPVINSKKRVTNGMTIEVLKEGSGVEIKSGQTAVVGYVGSLVDGTIFDASARHGQDFSFPLGAGMVIKGWDQGVVGMKVGETRKLTIPPELGYGASGAGNLIPPNATLVFEVTLVAIK